MKRYLLVLGVIILVGLGSWSHNQTNKVLVSREFPTLSWERFDYLKNTVVLEKPTTYDVELDVTFDESYPFNYFMMTFSVLDPSGNPLRAKDYKFILKDKDGTWKSENAEGQYHFRFPVNSELTLNEPGSYIFHIENRMPITPLIGIKQLSIISK